MKTFRDICLTALVIFVWGAGGFWLFFWLDGRHVQTVYGEHGPYLSTGLPWQDIVVMSLIGSVVVGVLLMVFGLVFAGVRAAFETGANTRAKGR